MVGGCAPVGLAIEDEPPEGDGREICDASPRFSKSSTLPVSGAAMDVRGEAMCDASPRFSSSSVEPGVADGEAADDAGGATDVLRPRATTGGIDADALGLARRAI